MKPHRLAMTHHLVLGYGLHKHMDVYVSSMHWLLHGASTPLAQDGMLGSFEKKHAGKNHAVSLGTTKCTAFDRVWRRVW